MEENNSGMDENMPTSKQKGGFRRWLENFIYHYKWHTIVAIVLIITVTISTVQMCSKTSIDVYVLYVGGYDVSKTSKNGDEAEYVTLMRSIARAAEDFDGDGETNVALDTLFMMTNEEIIEKNKELEAAGSTDRINQTLIMNNSETLASRMLFSEYYACLMSEGMYDVYTKKNGFYFSDLAPLVDDATSVTYYGEGTCAVYLNSTAFGRLPALCDLPDDTLIVLRALSEVSNTLNAEDNRENYDRSTRLVRNMLNY